MILNYSLLKLIEFDFMMYFVNMLIVYFLVYSIWSLHKQNKKLNNISDEVFEEVKSRVLIDFARIFKSNIILPDDPLKKTAKDMQKTYDSYRGVGSKDNSELDKLVKIPKPREKSLQEMANELNTEHPKEMRNVNRR